MMSIVAGKRVQLLRNAAALGVVFGLYMQIAGCADKTAASGAADVKQADASSFEERCAALLSQQSEELGVVTYAAPGPATIEQDGFPTGQTIELPAHCEVKGSFPSREGAHGQTYAITYHMRLPEGWNGRLLFQGGGGTNGVIGDALGATGFGNEPGFLKGYAVVSQDSGHDNAVNSDPEWGGVTVYGTDPQARRDYGHSSLPKVVQAAKTLINKFYGSAPKYSYFFGCSKGGQEGMAFAQRYPEMFDGIVAAAPGFSLPRAAVAQTWDVQTFAQLWDPAKGKLAPTSFATLFSEADFAIVHEAVVEACDELDGLRDDMIGAFAQCTSEKVLPLLRSRICNDGASSEGTCITSSKIDALERSLSGPLDGEGEPIYTDWPWDAGVGSEGWVFWKLGNAQMPSLNILTGGASLPTVFMTPPRSVGEDPQSLLDFQMSFQFPEDAEAVYAASEEFSRSAWEDIAMRSDNLDKFHEHGGKLIVPHGVSDPVFSINDTVTWYDEVNSRYNGEADTFVRVFPVPGMTHCVMGPSTDQYDAFAALTDWVEKGDAPDRIPATASQMTPWPGRTRPLCPYPQVAVYDGEGDVEEMSSFHCDTISE